MDLHMRENMFKDKKEVDIEIKEAEMVRNDGQQRLKGYTPSELSSSSQDSNVSEIKVPSSTQGDDLEELVDEKNVKCIGQNGTEEKEDPGKEGYIQKYKIRSTKLKSFKCLPEFTSITSEGRNTMWFMGCGRKGMYLYDDNGVVIKSVTVGDGGIYDMAITVSGDMIVTCRGMMIKRVSVDGDTIPLVDTSPFEPGGLCLNKNQEILVCMSGQIERNHVAVYSFDGSRKIREIRAKDRRGRLLVENPHLAAQNGNNFIILDAGSHVVSVNQEGYSNWVYGEMQARLSLSFLPRDICVDRYHNVLITDRNNHCVHYLSGEGQRIQLILTKEETGLWYPWGICIDKDSDQVWIENGFGDVVIAKYLT